MTHHREFECTALSCLHCVAFPRNRRTSTFAGVRASFLPPPGCWLPAGTGWVTWWRAAAGRVQTSSPLKRLYINRRKKIAMGKCCPLTHSAQTSLTSRHASFFINRHSPGRKNVSESPGLPASPIKTTNRRAEISLAYTNERAHHPLLSRGPEILIFLRPTVKKKRKIEQKIFEPSQRINFL